MSHVHRTRRDIKTTGGMTAKEAGSSLQTEELCSTTKIHAVNQIRLNLHGKTHEKPLHAGLSLLYLPRKFCFKPHCHPRVDLRKGAPEESHTLRLEKSLEFLDSSGFRE